MKAKIFGLLLVGVFCFSLAACGDSDIQSVMSGADDAGTEEEYELEIPEAVLNLSEEEDLALTGTLTADSYVNHYFGIRLNKPESGTISSIMDEGTDLTPLSKTFASGIGSVDIQSDSGNGNILVSIGALDKEDIGKTEEELVRERMEFSKQLNESMEVTSELYMETITIAGEEHPAFVEIFKDEDYVNKSVIAILPKGDFACNIYVSSPPENFDQILALLEKE